MKDESKTGARTWLKRSGASGTAQTKKKVPVGPATRRGLLIVGKYLENDIRKNGGSNHELFRGLDNLARADVFKALLYFQKVQAASVGLKQPKKYRAPTGEE